MNGCSQVVVTTWSSSMTHPVGGDVVVDERINHPARLSFSGVGVEGGDLVADLDRPARTVGLRA